MISDEDVADVDCILVPYDQCVTKPFVHMFIHFRIYPVLHMHIPGNWVIFSIFCSTCTIYSKTFSYTVCCKNVANYHDHEVNSPPSCQRSSQFLKSLFIHLIEHKASYSLLGISRKRQSVSMRHM